MDDWLNHPAVQAGIAPLVVALVVALLLARTRFAWLALLAGYAAMLTLTSGFAFSPLTAGRKVVLLGLVVPFVGLAIDLTGRTWRDVGVALAAFAGAAAVWAFWSVLGQREGTALWTAVLGTAAFVAALSLLTQRLSADGLRAGAAGVGLGVAAGVVGVLSASIGYLMAGIAIAAAAGALLLVQVIFSRSIAAGFTGTLPLGLQAGLFVAGTVLLAELKWWVAPLLLLVPLAVALPAPERAPTIVRAAVLTGYALAAAAVPILAAWFAARGS